MAESVSSASAIGSAVAAAEGNVLALPPPIDLLLALAADESSGADGEHRIELSVRRALLAWDGRGDASQARQLLPSIEHPVAAALLLQLVLDTGDRMALERLTRDARKTGDRAQWVMLGDLWLVRGDDPAQAVALFEACGETAAREVVLAWSLADRWDALLAEWQHAQGTDVLLVSAQVAQDRLGDVERARLLLRHAASTSVSEGRMPYLLERLIELDIDYVTGLRQKLARLAAPARVERAATVYLLAEALDAAHSEEAVALLAELQTNRVDFSRRLVVGALARRESARGNWRGAAQAWTELAQHIDDPRFAQAAQRRAAELWSARADDPETAERLYVQLFERHPHDFAVTLELARLRLRRKDFIGAVETIASQARPGDKNELIRAARAFEAMGDPRALARWQALIDNGVLDELQALETLARFYRRSESVVELIGVYRRLATRVEARAQASYLCVAGALALELGNIGEAEELAAAVITSRPNDFLGHALRAVCHLAAEQYRDYVAALAALMARTNVPRSRARLLREQARVLADALAEPATAEACYVDALGLSPDDSATLQAYARLCDGLGRWERAVELREQAAQRLEGSPQADVLCQVGDLYSHQLGDANKALQAYRHAAAADPKSRRALTALAELHRRDGNAEALWHILAQLEPLLDEASERLSLLVEMAELGGGPLGDPERALRMYHAALAIAPGHEAALAGFERLCRRHGRWAELVDALERVPHGASSLAVQRSLIEGLEQLRCWEPLGQALERQIALLGPGERLEAARVARRLARLYTSELQNLDAAARAWHIADEADPDDVEAARALQRIYEARGRVADIAAALERELVRVGHPPPDATLAERSRVLGLWMRLGELRYRQLGRPDQAAEAYEQALRIAAPTPASPEQATALQALVELYTTLQRPRDLQRVLDLRAAVSTDPKQRALVLQQKGELLERGGDLDGALAAYQEGFLLDPSSRMLFTAFERVAYRRENWQAAMQLYERAIRLVEVERQRAYRLADLYSRRGQVELHYLNQPGAAAASYLRVIELDPEAEQAQAALEQMYFAQNNWDGLIDVYARRAELVRDDPKRIDILRRAARVAVTRLRNPERAAELFASIHAIDPTDVDALDFLERHYERSHTWGKLVDVLRTRIVLTTSGDETIKLLLRIGGLCEERLRDPALAIEAYRKILDIAPSERNALDALARLYEGTERWAELIDVTRRQIRIVTDRAQKALLCFKCGSVMESKFGRDDEAIRYYDAAIRTSTTCLPAVHGLRDLYLRREDWPHVIDTLQLEVKLWTDNKECAGINAHIGQIYLEKLGEEERAIQHFEKALADDPESLPANRALFELYFGRGDYLRALPLGLILTQKIIREGEPAARSEFYRKRAVVALRTGDPRSAAESLVVGLEIRPENIESLDLLVALCRTHPDAYDFLTTFRNLEKVYRDRNLERALSRVFVGLGSLCELDYDIDTAEALYRDAIRLAPHDYPVVIPLVDLHQRLLRFTEAAEVLEHLLEQVTDGTTRADIRLRLARIYGDGAMNPGRAVQAIEALIAEEPSHRQAHFLLAQELYLLGRFPEAQTICERLIDLAAMPGRTAPPEELARYYDYLGRISEAVGDVAAAQRSYRRAIDLFPGFPTPVLALARRLFGAGEVAQTMALLEEGQSCAAQRGEAVRREFQRGLARFYAGYGDRQRALALYRAAIDGAVSSIAAVEVMHPAAFSTGTPPQLAALGSPLDLPATAGMVETTAAGGHDAWSIPVTPAQSSARAALELLSINEDRLALAELYMREPSGLEAARSELMQVLMTDVRMPSAYRLLLQVYLRTGQTDRAARVHALLELLGYTDAAEATPPPLASAAPLRARLDDELRRRLLLPLAAQSPYTEALGVLREALEAVFPPQQLGPFRSVEAGPLQACVQEMSRLFDVSAEVLIAPQVPGGILAIDLPRYLIILDQSLVGASDSEHRFLLGRAFEPLRGGYALPLRLGTRQRADLGRFIDQALLPEGIRDPAIQEFLGRLPRRALRALDRLVSSTTGMQSVPLDQWVAALEIAANRAGLLACNDAAAAAHVLARLGGEELAVSAEGAVTLGQLPEGVELVRYFLSDAYHELRAALIAK